MWVKPEHKEKLKKAAKKRYEENKEMIDKNLQIARDNRKGKIMSEETKNKLSIIKTGIPSPLKGKPLLESTKKKMSEATAKTYNVKLISPNKEIFGPIINLLEFCKKHGLRQSGIWCLINGKQKSSKGWKVYFD